MVLVVLKQVYTPSAGNKIAWWRVIGAAVGRIFYLKLQALPKVNTNENKNKSAITAN